MNVSKAVVAVDAMGGDHGPSVIVPGAVAALAAESSFELALYGNEELIRAELDRLECAGLAISVVPCSQNIGMGESPASAIRGKKDSPIVRAMTDQKQKRVQAVVSAGSTGAMVAASLIILGRLPGVDRPAIATLIPTVKGELLLLDAGANTQCTSEYLVSFARMGEVFSREMFGIKRPTIGQLNIGGEPKKGTDLCIETYALLTESGLNFIGNVEGDQLMLGPCDVVVTDGFTGNNTLKLVEGVARFMAALRQHPKLTEAEQSALLPVLGFLQKNFTYEVYGGAMLLGVDGISIISHGRSSAVAISNAVQVAADMIRNEVPAKVAAAHV